MSFICDPQYHLTGPATGTCLPSGNWSGTQPSCRRMCPALDNPEHGFIHGNHFWEGENVYFSCKPGYWLTGSSDRHCSLNGTWTEEKPKCIVLEITMESSILQSNGFLFNNLKKFLEQPVGINPSWKLCYRASLHGWGASTFHSLCDGKTYTVTLIRKGAFVFGGYTDIAWDSSSGWSFTSNAFIFSLINKEGLAPFKSMVKRPSNAIYRGSSYGPLFGSGNDIRIADNANSNTNSYTSFGDSYSVPSGVKDRFTILAGTQKFSPDEVEVFYRN